MNFWALMFLILALITLISYGLAGWLGTRLAYVRNKLIMLLYCPPHPADRTFPETRHILPSPIFQKHAQADRYILRRPEK
jgi:hypothetical protein